MTHTQCEKCRRRNIVVENRDGHLVLAHHYRKSGRKGGTCLGTGAEVFPLAGAA